MKQLKGIVISTKMQKTAVVKVSRLWPHPLYKKIMKKSKKYLCHDEIGVKDGDKVTIQESRPISKRKRFRIIEIIKANKASKPSESEGKVNKPSESEGKNSKVKK